MSRYEPNPAQIQFASPFRHPPPTPLVLIHDGGGTTFGYFSLQPLHRDVYAIHNPRFSTGEPWAGGIDEMARHYIQLLDDAGIRGPIFLGGWSLGGLISLEMARILADDDIADISIKGLLFIDVSFHIQWSRYPFEPSDPHRPGLPDLVVKSLDHCAGLLNTWQLPSWDLASPRGCDIHCRLPENLDRGKGQEVCIPTGQVYYQSTQSDHCEIVPAAGIFDLSGKFQRQGGVTDGAAEVPESAGNPQSNDSAPTIDASAAAAAPPGRLGPPVAVLLRCTQRAPSGPRSSGAPVRIDTFRDRLLLGWHGNYPEFIKAVFDVIAHHYSLFELDQIESVTASMNRAMEILESFRL